VGRGWIEGSSAWRTSSACMRTGQRPDAGGPCQLLGKLCSLGNDVSRSGAWSGVVALPALRLGWVGRTDAGEPMRRRVTDLIAAHLAQIEARMVELRSTQARPATLRTRWSHRPRADAAQRGEGAYATSWARRPPPTRTGGTGCPRWHSARHRALARFRSTTSPWAAWSLPGKSRRSRPAPTLAVLSTRADPVVEWLHAGTALHRLLLVATTHRLRAGFLTHGLVM
jgi:hypothetical protein